MSRTASVGFHGRSLWCATEALQVWLALLIEEAEELEARDERWFEELIQNWRVQAKVADLGATLEDEWSNEQLSVVMELAKRTRKRLSESGAADRLVRPGWSVLDGEPVAGGVGPIRVTERVDQVAHAFLLLLTAMLPPDPPGAWWFVGGNSDDWQQIAMRER